MCPKMFKVCGLVAFHKHKKSYLTKWEHIKLTNEQFTLKVSTDTGFFKDHAYRDYTDISLADPWYVLPIYFGRTYHSSSINMDKSNKRWTIYSKLREQQHMHFKQSWGMVSECTNESVNMCAYQPARYKKKNPNIL